MTPLSTAYVATAAICVVVGLQHVVMASRVEDRKPQLLFAIAAFAVAGDALFERRAFGSATAEDFLAWMPWTALCIASTIVALSWYIGHRTGAARRWMLWAVTALALLTVVLDFSVGIAYRGPVTLGTSILPWGEQVSYVSGATNPLRIVGDLVLLGFLLILFDSTVRMIRLGEGRKARLLGISLVIYALGLLTIIPADMGWFHLPSPHTFAFLLIVAAMSWDISEDLIRASQLSREVLANERTLITRDGRKRVIRWRSVVLRGADGEPEGLLSVGADVTERRDSEAQLERLAGELERAVAELEDYKVRLEEENVYLRETIRTEHGFADIVGGSDPLPYVLHKVRQVAPSDTSVLVLGETGVGKELIARTIHNESPRSDGPFVVVNCAALPPNLIESELFGHERGAFTGADRQRRGRFELAHGGTLFLDEVGDLPLEMQPKLLRVLQEGEMERVGGTETISVDVRVIAATNRDLNAEKESGRFREDLFYRIAVYPITVPPLRARREDIPLLVQHFVQHFARRRGVRIDEVPAEVMRLLQAYHWPGNVRELQNVIERAVLTSTDRVLRLAETLKTDADVKAPTREDELEVPRLTLDEVERRYIVRVLGTTRGQLSGDGGAAEILGLHANTLRYRMKKLGIAVGRKTGTISSDS